MKDIVNFQVGQEISIGKKVFVVLPDTHRKYKNKPYKQLSGTGEIRKLSLQPSNQPFALKVFAHPQKRLATNNQILITNGIHHIDGFDVAERIVLTPKDYGNVLQEFPSLKYSILMPWMPGFTWQEILAGQSEGNKHDLRFFLDKDSALYFASQLSEGLAVLESKGFAHCDLSSNNIILDPDTKKFFIVDIEDMYGPGLARDDKFLGGQIGYRHPNLSRRAQWAKSSDRFSGALLICEVLSLFNSELRKLSSKDSFFSQDELQQSGEKTQIFLDTVVSQIGKQGGDLFLKVWQSKNVSSCPTLKSWANVVKPALKQRNITAKQIKLKYKKKQELVEKQEKHKIKKEDSPSFTEMTVERPLVKRKRVELTEPSEDLAGSSQLEKISSPPIEPFQPKIDIKVVGKWAFRGFLLLLFCSLTPLILSVFSNWFQNQSQIATNTPLVNQSVVVATVNPTKIYSCDLFKVNPLQYHISIRSTDHPYVASSGSIESKGVVYHYSIENTIGSTNFSFGILDRVDGDVLCFDTISNAISDFEQRKNFASNVTSFDNMGDDNFGYMSQDKYQIVFRDSNIVVKIKGSSAFPGFPSSALQQTERQARTAFSNLKRLPKISN